MYKLNGLLGTLRPALTFYESEKQGEMPCPQVARNFPEKLLLFRKVANLCTVSRFNVLNQQI